MYATDAKVHRWWVDVTVTVVIIVDCSSYLCQILSYLMAKNSCQNRHSPSQMGIIWWFKISLKPNVNDGFLGIHNVDFEQSHYGYYFKNPFEHIHTYTPTPYEHCMHFVALIESICAWNEWKKTQHTRTYACIHSSTPSATVVWINWRWIICSKLLGFMV